MKLKRFLSGLLFGIGCAVTFIGLLSVILPSVANPQMQLVIASFGESSTHTLVDTVNRTMSFALSQQWRLVLIGLLICITGAWMLIFFTPRKTSVSKRRTRPQVTVQPAQPIIEAHQETEAPNPFANGHYTALNSLAVPPKNTAGLRAKPIFDPNIVEESETNATVAEPEAHPYFSPRLEAEAHAVRTEVGDASQSGSRILIRPVPLSAESVHEPAEKEIKPTPALRTSIPETVSPSAPAEKTVQTQVSSRIRSTMGKHTPHNAKFIPPRS